MVWEDLKPRDIVTAAAIDNAVTAVLAIGGSTNAVVHLVAIARRAGIPLDRRPLRAIAREDAARRQRAARGQVSDGGLLLRRRPARAARDHRRPALARRRAPSTAGRWARTSPTPRSSIADVILPRDKPLVATDSLAVLRGNLAPDGAVIKPAAAEAHLLQHTGHGGRVRRLQRHGRAHRRSRPAGRPPTRCSC